MTPRPENRRPPARAPWRAVLAALAVLLALGPWTALADPRPELEEVRAQLQETARQLGELREQHRAALTRLARIEAQRGAAERIIQQYAGGIAFIQGAYLLTDGDGRPLRYAGAAAEANGSISVFSPDGTGPEVTFEFNGTGFVVSAEGLLLTNRHVVEPWAESLRVQGLLRAGFRPRLTVLRAFFPGYPEPFPLEIAARASETDVALLRFDPRGAALPVLPLAGPEERSEVGAPVLLLGYPAGLPALVAKAELRPSALTADGPLAGHRLAESLARRGFVRPLATQGHIGDLLPHQIVYDALTAVGGSGGPLFSLDGKVIGINYAILSGFGGSSFAIPIRWGQDLLEMGGPQARQSSARLGPDPPPNP